MWQYNNVLQHHGILGMRWGKRRTTEQSGHKPYSDRQKTHMTKQAIQVLSRHSKSAAEVVKMGKYIEDKQYKKADKLVWKSEEKQAKGDQKGFEKYQGKAWKHMGRSIAAGQIVQARLKQKQLLDKKISDIREGKTKAGKDFVAGLDVRYNILQASLTRYVDTYSGKKKTDSYETKDSVVVVPILY